MTESLYYSKRKQKCCHQSQKKSDLRIQQSEQSNKLPCQELRLCNRGKKKLILPEAFTVLQEKPNLLRVNRYIDVLNFVLSAVRSDRSLNDADALIPMPIAWAGCRWLLFDKTLSIWQVVFRPYVPCSVIKYDTVFTALHRLANVANTA